MIDSKKKANLIHTLIKIGKKEHIKGFQENGIMYMNSFKFFKKMEEDNQRKDIHEGIEKITQVNWVKFNVDGKELELSKKLGNLSNAQFRVNNDSLSGNIFSMLSITDNLASQTDKIDMRNSEFGNYLLIINNPKEFLARVDKAMKSQNHQYIWNLVKYYDKNTYNGNLSIFNKPNKFQHQSEFRFFVNNNSDKPIILKIGSIKDISTLLEIEELENLRFSYESLNNL